MEFPDVRVDYVIICALAVVAAYLGVSLAALIQVWLNQRAKARAPALDGDDADWITSDHNVAPAEASSMDKWRAPHAPDPVPAHFGNELVPSAIEGELQQLRDEVAALKECIANVKAIARRISPEYDEAMVLAECGVQASDIAVQCGMSAAEAALVLALSDNQRESKVHEP